MAYVLNISRKLGLSIYRLAGGGMGKASDFTNEFDGDFN